MSRKICVVLTGTNAVGKTTARKAMAGKDAVIDSYVEDESGEKWTLYRKTEQNVWPFMGVAGDHNSGSDSNLGPDKIIMATRQVFDGGSTVCVIDGVMTSPRWCETISRTGHHKIADFMLIYAFDFTPEQAAARMLLRRIEKGNPHSVSESTMKTICSQAGRSKTFRRHVVEKLLPSQYEINSVDFSWSPDEIAECVWKRIAELQR